MSKVVAIPREDGGLLITYWLASVKYIKDTEAIQFTFSSKIIPYFYSWKDIFYFEWLVKVVFFDIEVESEKFYHVAVLIAVKLSQNYLFWYQIWLILYFSYDK